MASGEFFSLLGPSGCGKTTTLRLIAGFEQPTSGQILLDGADVSAVPPHRRNVNTVFQSYALFPFLTVFDNVAFGLRYAKTTKAELQRPGRRRRSTWSDDRRSPRGARGQLSGGQQQRVALARALVLNPAVLLLDEPLGALDAKLRRSLKVELKALQERVGITFLYVTHDQEEALTMSDRLAVMNAGRIAQIGTPREVYEEPADAYVADFLGAANLMEISVSPRPRPPRSSSATRCWTQLARCRGGGRRGPAHAVIRPERVRSSRTARPAPTGCPPWSSASSSSAPPPRSCCAWPTARRCRRCVQNDGERPDLDPGHPGARLPRRPTRCACWPARPPSRRPRAPSRRRWPAEPQPSPEMAVRAARPLPRSPRVSRR